jgi:hypothetical protein
VKDQPSVLIEQKTDAIKGAQRIAARNADATILLNECNGTARQVVEENNSESC